MVGLAEISQQSSSSSTYDYDVFLSFRGEDTRCNFTDHLLKALREATIDTFFDDAEIHIGEFLKPELENAIRSSRASIIVLSKDYASSTWCLDELALIMEQRRTSKHIVFPIFYHVKPSDVRAMAGHKQRVEAESSEEKRSQWEKALAEVADLKGEEADGRLETILIEGIVKEISSRLDLHKRSEIPKLIGMAYSVAIITSFLKDGCGKSTEILTIWGMAGIGKTYLANYVFQLHYLDFERSCFLEDIDRRCTTPNGMLDLQKQLLKDIRARSWIDIDNVDAATLKIEKSLSRKRTFLVLDSINKFEQLDMLIGTKGLHAGSKIIITSKNRSLTEKCRLFRTKVPPKHTMHFLQGLDDEEALQLLSWHAFGRNKPNEGDKKEPMKVVKYCKGHPLALKVLGSSFRGEDATWEDILESLGREINPNIKEVLKGTTLIQGLVLDMSTFENETSKQSRSVNMQKLGFRSFSLLNWIYILLSVIWWLFGWISRICSSSHKRKHDFETIALSEMCNLRLLKLNYVQLGGSYKNFPQGLKWLCMLGFPLSYISSDLDMENMVALDMSNSKLQHLWKKPKLLRSLKFLNLSSCHKLVRVGNFSGLPLLERLTLARCTSLDKVCESIGTYCHKLEVLDVSECSMLKELPRSIRRLKNLTQLLIDGCLNLVESSVTMTLMGSPRSSMSFVISLPRSLVKMSLTNCNLYTESVPMDFSSLSMLRELYLGENPIDSMPDCLRSLSRLERLSFEGCRSLKRVLGAPSTLVRLDIFGCCSLEKVTFHPEKSAPPKVTVFAASITEIQGKFKLQVLSEIDESVLCSLGWSYIEYSKYCQSAMNNFVGLYDYRPKTVPAAQVDSPHRF